MISSRNPNKTMPIVPAQKSISSRVLFMNIIKGALIRIMAPVSNTAGLLDNLNSS